MQRCLAIITAPRKPRLEQLAKGHDVLLEIDWQGAQQVRNLFPESKRFFLFHQVSLILREF